MTDALAQAAIAEIQDGMTVGLGTGRAATRAIEAVAKRANASTLLCVATSEASDQLARKLGLRVQAMDVTSHVDVLIDGADEVDPQLRMIKGRGGAMTREKIVAHASARCIYLAQTSKLVTRLGEHARLPIEVMRFGLASTQALLATLGLVGTIRQGANGDYITDNGNPVIDAVLPNIADLDALATSINAIPSVVGHGLFLDEAALVLIEDDTGAVTRRAR